MSSTFNLLRDLKIISSVQYQWLYLLTFGSLKMILAIECTFSKMYMNNLRVFKFLLVSKWIHKQMFSDEFRIQFGEIIDVS